MKCLLDCLLSIHKNINIMYQKILSGELRFPSYVSAEAQSILEGFLNRDVEKRLGSNCKSHPWFKDIDWDKLERKEIEPPFKPKVKSAVDVAQIDPVFTQEKPQDSLVDGGLSDAISKENFDGFTYVSKAAIDG